jgi:hypothetical protein
MSNKIILKLLIFIFTVSRAHCEWGLKRQGKDKAYHRVTRIRSTTSKDQSLKQAHNQRQLGPSYQCWLKCSPCSGFARKTCRTLCRRENSKFPIFKKAHLLGLCLTNLDFEDKIEAEFEIKQEICETACEKYGFNRFERDLPGTCLMMCLNYQDSPREFRRRLLKHLPLDNLNM